MDWFTDKHCFKLAVVMYAVCTAYAVFLWRKGFRKDNRVIYLLLLCGFVFHTTAMLKRGLSLQHCPVSNLYEATAFAMWTLVTGYMLIGAFRRVRFLGAFASPLLFGMGVFALMPGLDSGTFAAREAPSAWTSVHAAIMSLSYGAFGLSCVAGMMYLTQERNLKFNKLQAVFSLLPPVQRLDTVVGRALVVGHILLTSGLVLGALGLVHLKNPGAYYTDPKVLWSCLVWLIYAGLILMRWKFAQGGRRFALGAIWSFLFVLLTFWGTNVLSPLHNPQ